MRETDPVVLTRDLPAAGLTAGDVGTVVLVHQGDVGYEVEFVTLGGRTLVVVALQEQDIRSANDDEVLHARRLVTVTAPTPGIAQGASVDIFPGITVDPGIRFGKPCLKGTRVDVAAVVGALAAGEDFEAVEQAYGLTRGQVLDALRYASHASAHMPPLDWQTVL